MRAYYWFITFTRCSPQNSSKVFKKCEIHISKKIILYETFKGLNIDYQFEFFNGDTSFVRQFSADEMGKKKLKK